MPALFQHNAKVYLPIQIAVITGLHSFYVITVLLFEYIYYTFLIDSPLMNTEVLFNFCKYRSKMGAYRCRFGIWFSFKYMPHDNYGSVI